MLSIKSQKIVPSIPSEAKDFSFVVEGDSYFGVFSYKSSNLLSVSVVQNIIEDILSHQISVIDKNDLNILSFIESVLKECKDSLEKLSGGVFDAAFLFISEKFFYLGIYGAAKALHLDGSSVVHADIDKEGKYAVGAYEINEDKVMILCTEEFYRKFPPQKLLSLQAPILGKDLSPLDSAIILKVELMNEVPKKQDLNEESKVSSGEESESTLDVYDKGNVHLTKRLRIFTYLKQGAIPIKQVFNTLLKKRKIALLVFVFLGVGGLLFFTFQKVGFNEIFKFFSFRKSNYISKDKGEYNQENTQPNETGGTESREADLSSELSRKLDEANKVKRVKTQVFYDISIVDPKAVPNELVQGENYVAVAYSKQGKIFVSKKDTVKFDELPQLFMGVRNLQINGDTLVFTDNEGVKFYSLTQKAVVRSFLNDQNYIGIKSSVEYLGFTYALVDDKIIKFSKVNDRLKGDVWAQDDSFVNAHSIAVDGSIYILFSDGKLQRYTGGKRDDFEMVGLDKDVASPTKVVARPNFKLIYVGDAEIGRIAAFDSDGVLKFQIKPQIEGEWKGMKSFDVASDEKTFYVLVGTKVFEFILQ